MTMLVAVFETDEQARLALESLEEGDGSSMTSTTES